MDIDNFRFYEGISISPEQFYEGDFMAELYYP